MLQQRILDFALLGAEWVLWLLVALSILCVAVAIERIVYAMLNRTDMEQLQSALGGFFESGDSPALLETVKHIKGVEARVLTAGMDAAIARGPEAAEDALLGCLTFERLKLERGLIVLATVGSNAPFIGLFGTVIGIIMAFNDLSMDTADATAAVMAGISEALVATAVGLIVAIPAVVAFNVFQRRNRDRLGRIESLGHLVPSQLKGDAAKQLEA